MTYYVNLRLRNTITSITWRKCHEALHSDNPRLQNCFIICVSLGMLNLFSSLHYLCPQINMPISYLLLRPNKEYVINTYEFFLQINIYIIHTNESSYATVSQKYVDEIVFILVCFLLFFDFT